MNLPIRRLCYSLLVFAFSGVNGLFAQVLIQNVRLETNQIGPKSLFYGTVQNTGNLVQLWFEGELTATNGQMVVAFRTEPITLATGVKTISSSELVMRTFTYGSSDGGRIARLFQRLPGGSYRYCIRARTNSEGEDQFCDGVDVEEYITLDLVHPWDKDTIDEVRPTLMWTMNGLNPSMSTSDVRLVLAPMSGSQNPAQTIASERPLFIIPKLNDRSVPYPAGVQDLDRGKCYAWQVERTIDGRVMDRSEPWGFCVRKPVEQIAAKYIRLDHPVPGMIYDAVDQRIYFRYDEPYASSRMECSIYDSSKGQHIVPEVKNEGGTLVANDGRSVGANLFELDLQPYGLGAGSYELRVKDGKGTTHTLLFRIKR